jgi:hypothetical protein
MKRSMSDDERKRNECCCRLGFEYHTRFDQVEVSQRVIHACGILYFVESSLKVWVLACSRSDRHVKLSLV